MKLHVASPRCRLLPGDVRDEFEFGVFLGCQSCQLYTGSWELNFAMLCTYETSVSFGMSRQQVEKLLLIIRISTCCDIQRAEYSCLQHANDGGALHESLASSSSHCPAPALLRSPASTGTGKSSDLGHVNLPTPIFSWDCAHPWLISKSTAASAEGTLLAALGEDPWLAWRLLPRLRVGHSL